VPDSQSTPEEKGTYALFLMLLFRPHREISEIARPRKTAQASPQKLSNDKKDEAAWTAVYEEFLRWRTHDIDAPAAPHFRKANVAPLPELRLHGNRSNSARRTWWACLISEKLRNYDAANRLHKVEASKAPQDLDTLPLYDITGSGDAGDAAPGSDPNASND